MILKPKLQSFIHSRLTVHMLWGTCVDKAAQAAYSASAPRMRVSDSLAASEAGCPTRPHML